MKTTGPSFTRATDFGSAKSVQSHGRAPSPRSPGRSRWHALAALALALLMHAAPALAQRRVAPAPSSEPVMSFRRSQDWTLHFEVVIQPPRADYSVVQGLGVQPTSWLLEFDSAEFVFPAPQSSATHDSRLDNWNFKSTLTWRNALVNDKSVELPGSLASGRYLMLEAPLAGQRYIGDLARLTFDLPMTCREAAYDERRASAIPWPANPWEPDIAECLKPQPFIESDSAEVRALVDRWTQGRGRSAPPARLAKFLTGQVLELIQPSGDGLLLHGPAETAGFRVQGARAAILTPRPVGPDNYPTSHDMACALVAVLRAAGLPARLVVMLDALETDKRQSTVFRSRAEFYLLDEAAPMPPNWPVGQRWPGRGEWIPVDVGRQREFSSRAPPIDQKWDFFGNDENADDMLPISFQFHPPTGGAPVVASTGSVGQTITLGSYAFWGWRAKPATPPVSQQIVVWGQHTVRRGGE